MPDEFCYKIFRQGDDTLLAVSDSSIIGKTFNEGDIQINVSRDFYHGKECSRNEIIKILKSATIVNAVGKKIVDIMVKENIIESDSVLIIEGVPHAQIIYVK
jgi:hypothetical protein